MYTEKDANIEFTNRIEKCIWSKDVSEAFAIAQIFAEQDDMQEAEKFRKMASSWRDENLAEERN